MAVIERRIGTIVLSTNISNSKHAISIRGDLYPFAHRFHAAHFAVRCNLTRKQGVEATVTGFGGNSFELDEAGRMMEAVKIAHEQATYYKDLVQTLQSDRYYLTVMKSLIARKDTDGLLEALLLTPASVKPEEIEEVLRLLNANVDALGLGGDLKDAMSQDFYEENPLAVDAILTLCEHHPDFTEEDGDMAGAAFDLIYRIMNEKAA